MLIKSLICVLSLAAFLGAGSEAHAVGELIELLLAPRTDDDQAMVPDGDGVFELEVDQPFDLEVSFNELRLFNERLGAERLLTNISFSQGGVLEPILNETLRLIVGEEIQQNTSGSLTFSIEGSATTHVSQLLDFVNDSRGEVVNALTTFGYTPSQYELTSLDFGTDDIVYQIHYLGDEFGNQDLPDISLVGDFPIFVPTQTIEFSPQNPDGSLNADAFRFNVDYLSRTFNDNEPFYSSLGSGSYFPSTGFEDVGGQGPAVVSGGIPDLTNDGGFVTPFDAFSVRARFTQPVMGFVASVSSAGASDAILLYGRDEAVPPSQVLLDENASVTFDVVPAPEPSLPLLQAIGFSLLVLMRRLQRRERRREGAERQLQPRLSSRVSPGQPIAASNSGSVFA